MADRQFKPDLAGSGETLESLLARLRMNLRPARPRRDGPNDWDSFVTSRRPPRGAGGAEAPIPCDRPAADAYAPI
ncbi:hypothetical protein [Phenylobacterium sp.]|uniref:hypothetical protein n=1 Tax=Phenylobacterium sp. TaxID=1871053 RepID=UPI0012055754|nr:hypothetical protein [Phenylobacterium sp.]THD58531.1 MAG: hypothetical protein E8A49_18570 [Phenylobacterium sp.]